MTLKYRRVWVALLLIGTVLRFGSAIRDDELRDDERSRYIPIAQSLSEGNGFAIGGTPTALSMPLWPIVLAALPDGLRAELLSALLSSLSLLLAWMLARRLANDRVALVVLAFMALDVDQISAAGTVLTEPLFGLLLLLFAVAWADRRIGLAGVALGLATLTRPEVFLLPGAIFLFDRSIRRAAILSGIVVLMLAPWWARNTRVFGEFVPFATTGGTTMAAGMNAGDEELSFRRKGQGRGRFWKEVHAEPKSGNEAADDKKYRNRAIDYALENPGQAALATAAKAVLLWTPVQRKGTSIVYALAVLLAWWAIVKRTKFSPPLVGPALLLLTLVGLMFVAIPRYRVPYHVFMFMLAATPVAEFRRAPRL
ncbi:MAG: hypothetical protein V3T86_05890 [Planctomycetota bacterium]